MTKPATILAQSGRPDRVQGSPVNPPIVLSSTYRNSGTEPGNIYARWDTETWNPFEQTLAALEGADFPALVHSSGMAAITTALHAARPGRIVAPRHSYHASLVVAREMAEREGGEVVTVDIANTDEVVSALPGASAVLLESPTNPMLELADIPTIADAAHEAGTLVIVDNTFATPLGQQPLSMGADIVVHSATKYLAGHSDVILGAALAATEELHQTMWDYRTHTGSVAGPFETWLALRGMRTLSLRFERITANAAELARRLADHPLVEAVAHPSLPDHPNHERAPRGCGVLTLRPKGGREAADRLVEATSLWLPATSLGGVESSLERRRRFADEAETVPEDLLRLSCGIEDIEDLWEDLDRALGVAVR
ncbi:PLP-dependent transferase [Flaviflexus salsibiostraticola]|uniref:homocysteine desulfhydrase n=1 Tax=Flaviflexus salsibiostraticola TaxID=1282737 RepID=A0A3Q8WSZ3_9ACTO|nr:PLP-dependent aspartate aminotransferase family protein [Flaviflexus salsibiostraticola]AZN29587.1 PLP-dependent transferase [Flaviflexus salsibiostraticola]